MDRNNSHTGTYAIYGVSPAVGVGGSRMDAGPVKKLRELQFADGQDDGNLQKIGYRLLRL